MVIKNYDIEYDGISGNVYFEKMRKDLPNFIEYEVDWGYEHDIVGHIIDSTVIIKRYEEELNVKIEGREESVIKTKNKLEEMFSVKLNEIKEPAKGLQSV